MRSPKQLVAETAKFFATHPDAFLQGSLARDARSNSVAANDPKATCWCTVGYLAKLIVEDDPTRTAEGEDNPYKLISDVIGIPSNKFVDFNDDDVAFDDVVEFLKGEANVLA